MSRRSDFTRWNRSGLRHFQYVDGNAVEYMEFLRQRLHQHFPQWEYLANTQDNVISIGDEDAEQQRQQRVLSLYHADRADWGLEIIRTFSRSCHILTEHLNAYANEGYLETATQWDHVRRLVEMLDYHPAPPSSASTLLALEAKDNVKGTVNKGFQVKYTPPQGGESVIYETLDDLLIDYRLNAVRLSGWNRSEDLFNPFECGSNFDSAPWSIDSIKGISAGQLGLLMTEGMLDQDGNTYNSELASPVTIKSLDQLSGRLCLEGTDNNPMIKRGYTRLLLNPKQIYVPYANGDGIISLEQVNNFRAGDVIAWEQAGWRFDVVTESSHNTIRLRHHQAIPPSTHLYKLLRINTGSDGRLRIPLNLHSVRHIEADGGLADATSLFENETGDVGSRTIAQVLTNPGSISEVYVLDEARVNETLSDADVNLHVLAADAYQFPGKPGKLKSGHRVVGEFQDSNAISFHLPLIVETLQEFDTYFQISVSRILDIQPSVTGSDLSLKRLYGPFQHTIRPVGYDKNTSPVSSDLLSLELDTLPDALKPGRVVLIQQRLASGETKVRKNVINQVIPPDQIRLLHPVIEADEFTSGNLIIRANVIEAGHGEIKGEKVLGSGNATLQNQSFILNAHDVSFVSDSTMPSGVRADITVNVEGKNWKQVGSLRASKSTDPHYTVRMTESGQLRINFGDGQTRGRRLPTGNNNIRVSYRTGVGLKGNVPVAGLEKPVKPHRFIDKVTQPLPASGGNDMEDVASLRDNAPSSLLSLERAVSLQDFADLAVSQSSIWQATAFQLAYSTSRQENIEVVVVPAGGVELNETSFTPLVSPVFIEDQRRFLRAHALPGVSVMVSIYQPVLIDLDITIRIKYSEFDPGDTVKRLRDTVIQAFGIQARKLGVALYRSDLYKVVESVPGVENSDCRFTQQASNAAVIQPRYVDSLSISGEAVIRRIQPEKHQLVYLDIRYSNLNITPLEYEL